VAAIEAALVQRAATGRGQHLDLALLDTMVGVLANQGLDYLASGIANTRMGNAHPTIVPYQAFPASDGDMVIAVGNDRQFRALAGALHVPGLADDPRFATNPARVVNRAELVPLLAGQTRTLRRHDLLARLEQAGVPAGPINTVAEVFADPQVAARGMRLDLDDGGGAAVPGIRTPILMSDATLRYDRPAPRLGEHTGEVLRELGYDEAAISALAAKGVTAPKP
jgi:crotonobetainyl-CoA:carnitine CoA-transferase CaiB-like acyl-CoA transferase